MAAAAVAEIVGRERELALLEDFVGAQERPAALVLQGETGIGKTVLWEAAVDRARASSQRVLACRPSEAETTLAFAALGDLLAPVAETTFPALPRPQRHALGVALLLEPAVGPPPDVRAIGSALVATLQAVARDQPLLLAVDDGQWLDRASADALEFAVRRLETLPVGLLLARRSTTGGALPLGLDRSFRDARLATLELGPISLGAMHRLLGSRLGLELPRPTLRRVYEASGGNSFFALEIGAVLRERSEPLDPSSPLPIPENLHELLRRRIEAVSPRARKALLATAAAAEPTAAVIEAASSSAAVEEAIAADVVAFDGIRLRFTHPLLAESVYAHATPRRRREIHRRLAHVLTEPQERARHLGLATEHPEEAIAAELEAAASRAYDRGAPAAAAELSDHARRLTPDDRAEALLARTASSAEYHLAAGDTARGRALLEQVVGARRQGPQRAHLLLRLGRVRYTADDVATAHDLFGRALAEAGDDLRLATEAEQALAFTAIGRGEIPLALAHARSSLAHAEQLDDPGLLALALCRVAQTEFLSGKGLDRASIERAVGLEEHVGDVPIEWLPSYAYGYMAMFADDLETSHKLFEALHRSAVELGDERALTTSLLVAMSMRARAAGDWGLAGSYAAEAVDRSRQSGLATAQTMALSELAFVSALIGRVEVARGAAEEGLRIALEAGARLPVSMHVAALGFLELSLGDPAAAHGHLGPLAQSIVAMGLGEPGVAHFLPDEIEALVALGELDAAKPPLLMLEERGRALGRTWALATVGRCRALLEASTGDFGAARASLDEALTEHARLGQPFELGRTLLVQGTIERRAGRRRVARTSLERAFEIFDELGAPLWAEKARAELRRFGGRPAAGGELTSSEQRVAELVAEGRSNKEVAATLFVTRQTVEKHLTQVYAKLGVRSRAELARRFRSQ